MADHDQTLDLENLGETIQSIIDQAVSSKDFQKLNQNVRQTVNHAIDTGTEALRKAQVRQQTIQEQQRLRQAQAQAMAAEAYRRNQAKARARSAAQYAQTQIPTYNQGQDSKVTVEPKNKSIPNPKKFMPVLYGSTTGRTLGGIFKSIGGGLLGFGEFLHLFVNGIMVLAGTIGAGSLVGPALLMTGGIALLANGVSDISRMNRFEKYVKALGDKTYCSMQRLSSSVQKPVSFVRKDVNKMISQRLFLEGHVDQEGKTLITSDETFAHYQETLDQQRQQQLLADAQKKEEQRLAAQKQKEEERLAAERAAKNISPQVQEVLDRGNAFLADIRRANEAIPGPEISEKISRMEVIIQRIFERAENHPEVVPDLKKLMDYYLPMTIKLLNAYAEMDRQPIQGETIQASKREIEGTLDTLNQAFEKLLDSIFKETALDVSSDISVLQTLLAQEGLTDDELTKLKKEQLL